MPKLLASERWVDWSWTGGEEYREWLITLPLFPATDLVRQAESARGLAQSKTWRLALAF